jgi:CRP-like cAMP-binding protein
MELDSSSRIDNRLFEALVGRCETISCDESVTLFKEGDKPRGVYIIRSGEASLLSLSASGKIISSFTAESGSVLGLPSAVANTPYSLTAVVRKGSVIGFIRLQDFHSLLRSEPTLYPCVLVILSSEIRSARTALANAFDGAPSHRDYVQLTEELIV